MPPSCQRCGSDAGCPCLVSSSSNDSSTVAVFPCFLGLPRIVATLTWAPPELSAFVWNRLAGAQMLLASESVCYSHGLHELCQERMDVASHPVCNVSPFNASQLATGSFTPRAIEQRRHNGTEAKAAGSAIASTFDSP